MKFFDAGQHAEGVIAIGQMATGVIAIGQIATGVIAIGQVTRGVFCIGMVAVGLYSVGMLSIGLVWSGGMLGAGGRSGFGFILPLVPRFGRRARLPATVPLPSLLAGRVASGWTTLEIVRVEGPTLHALYNGSPVALRMHDELAAAAAAEESLARQLLLARIGRAGDEPVCLELMRIPDDRRGSAWWAKSILQLAALAGLAVAYWYFVLVDLGAVVARAIASLAG